jgi:hypothetical protein
MGILRNNLVVVFFLLAISGCNKEINERTSEQKIVKISNSYVMTELRDDVSDYKVFVHDDGDTWIVSYHLPPGRTGGGPIVQIDKETGTIVGAYKGGQ